MGSIDTSTGLSCAISFDDASPMKAEQFGAETKLGGKIGERDRWTKSTVTMMCI
jgi:hypothetical protein